MAMYDDDNFGGIFPTRTGTPTGSANERKMLDSIGGSDGFRTQQKTNSDGSVTMLRTRNGMPEFSRNDTKRETIDKADIKGLVTNGVLEDNNVASDGRDSVKNTTVFPGGDAVGEAYQVHDFELNGAVHKNALVSGATHWFVGENLGQFSWVYVPSFEAVCWKVTITNWDQDLASFTLIFEEMPTTDTPPPSRSVAQTVVVTGASLLDDSDEAFPSSAMVQIEDIAPNGGRIIIVNACDVTLLNYAAESYNGPHVIGRSVFAACELTISGTPPAASVTFAPLYNNVQARGTYSDGIVRNTIPVQYIGWWRVPGRYGVTVIGHETWTGVLVGLRYEYSGKALTVGSITMDVDNYIREEATNEGGMDEPVLIESSEIGDIYYCTDPGIRVYYEGYFETTVTMEGVVVKTSTGPQSTINPSGYRDGGSYIECYPGDDPKTQNASGPGWGYPEVTVITDASATPNTLSFGAATFPRNSGGKGTSSSSPITSTVSDAPAGAQQKNYISVRHLKDLVSDKYISRPMWSTGSNRAVMNYVGYDTYTSTDITYATTGWWQGGGAILPVKYANRVFGLQASLLANINYTGAVVRGIGMVYPACIGKADPLMPNTFYSTVAADRLGPKLSNPTSTIQSRDIQTFAPKQPVTGTSRYLQPKAVVDLEHVVYAHYFTDTP